MFQKNDFIKSLKDVLHQNIQFNLTTDKKDSKFQDLGKIEDSSIVYVGGYNKSELNLINYNMTKMSRDEKCFEVPKDDRHFPATGMRSIADAGKNVIYITGGKTDENYTTNRCYTLKQVNKTEGKFIEVHKLDNMLTSRAFHGLCVVNYK